MIVPEFEIGGVGPLKIKVQLSDGCSVALIVNGVVPSVMSEGDTWKLVTRLSATIDSELVGEGLYELSYATAQTSWAPFAKDEESRVYCKVEALLLARNPLSVPE